MRILALNWQDLTNPQAGGAEVHLEELLRRLVCKGHEVTLFCSAYDGAEESETIEGVKIIRKGSRYNFNLIAPLELRRLVKKYSFDILIEDINKIPFYTPLYLNLPTLIVVPHLFSTSVFKEINFILGLYIYLAERPLVSVYKKFKFNVISESTADDIARRGIARENISVVHCGIDEKRYSYDPSVGKFEKPTVLYLGRIKKYKSIDHLLEAFSTLSKEMPDAELKIVGSGDYLPQLRKRASALGISRKVEFTGYVSSTVKVDFLRRSHLSVYPSMKEGWGLTNIEANACGTAVLAANSPGLRDSVVDGKTGFLYEYGNIAEMASKMKQVLSDESIRHSLESGGREWARIFNWDDAAERFLEVINNVVGQERIS